MYLNILTDHFEGREVLDKFTSLIWTERYNNAGEFSLVLPTADVSSMLTENNFLQLPESSELMQIETVLDENGVTTVAGRTLAAFLENRVLRNTWQTTKDSVNMTGTAGSIALSLVDNVCSGELGVPWANATFPGPVNEAIENLTTGTDPGGSTYNMALPYGDLYTGVKTACDMDDLGFRMTAQWDLPVFNGWYGFVNFEVYRGRDLTSTQNLLPAVIFEPATDTLVDLKTLRSISGYKTHAYAWAAGMTAQSSIGVAVAPGASAYSDWKRRTLMVDANDVTASDYSAVALKQILDQKARDALANNNYVRMVDGTLVPQSFYRFGSDYLLGDVIELRAKGTLTQQARITEYTRAQDDTGERAFPTLSVIA
jgi:hypothetical protein